MRWRALPSAITYTTLPAGRSTTLCSGTTTAAGLRPVTMAPFTVPPASRPPSLVRRTCTSRARLVSLTVGLTCSTVPSITWPGAWALVKRTGWPGRMRAAALSG